MARIKINSKALDELSKSADVAKALGEQASRVRSRMDAPEDFTVSTRSGVGPQGAFAQVAMHGSGALAVEFGSKNNPPMAPLRRALHGRP